jgi:MFS superfamily sulfate permease-like transporter
VPGITLFPSLRAYQRSWLDGDLIAGLTVWAVLVPEALAYATIAGVSPVVGLYAAPPALVLYAAFGSSRHLITGPMAATAALSAAAVADLVTGGPSADPEQFAAFTVALALATGVLALLAGILRLGFVASWISELVLKGFIIGLALTIMIGQLPKLFGFEKEEGNFFEQAWDFLGNLGETEWRTLVIGAGSPALVLVLREVAPKVPGSLVVVILGILAVNLLDLDAKGSRSSGTSTRGFPPSVSPTASGRPTSWAPSELRSG